MKSKTMPLIFAHRGASEIAYENSFTAFEHAIRIGADGLETDCWLTKDRYVVLYHDKTLSHHPQGKKLRINRMKLADIQAFPLPNGEKIPSLSEFFDAYKDIIVRNHSPHPLYFSMDMQDNHVAKKVIEIAGEYKLLDRILLCVNTSLKVRRIRRLSRNVRLVLSNMEYFLEARNHPDRQKLLSAQPEAFNIQVQAMQPNFSTELQKLNMDLFLWDVQTPPILKKALQYQPKIIYTDNPGEMRQWLKSVES